jgi:ribonuclease G
VYDELTALFEEDRAITKVLPMSDFGLVQITRQRLRPSLTTSFESSHGTTARESGSEQSGGDRKRLREAQSQLGRLERRLRSAKKEIEKREEEIERLEETHGEAELDNVGGSSAVSEEMETLKKELERAQQALHEERSKHGQTRSARDQAQAQARDAEAEAREAKAELEAAEAKIAEAKAANTAQQTNNVQHGAEATRPAQDVVDSLNAWVANHADQHGAVTLRVHPFLAAYLTRAVPSYPTRWFMDHFVRVHLDVDESVSPLSFAIDAPDTGATLVEA